MLIAARALAEHPLAQRQQHQQAGGERRLHHHERREQQRHDLKWPAEDRDPGAEQPARASQQAAEQRQAQVLLVWRGLGLHGL